MLAGLSTMKNITPGRFYYGVPVHVYADLGLNNC